MVNANERSLIRLNMISGQITQLITANPRCLTNSGWSNHSAELEPKEQRSIDEPQPNVAELCSVEPGLHGEAGTSLAEPKLYYFNVSIYAGCAAVLLFAVEQKAREPKLADDEQVYRNGNCQTA